MNIRSRLPPLGPLTAIGIVVIVHFYLGEDVELPLSAMPVSPAEQGIAEVQGGGLRIAPLSDIEAGITLFQERPLLAEGRRPPKVVPNDTAIDAEEISPEQLEVPEPLPEPEPEPVVIAAPDLPPIRMLGRISNTNGDAVLIGEEAEASQRWMRLGDEVAGWTLVEITDVSIRLSAAGTEITIGLFQ